RSSHPSWSASRPLPDALPIFFAAILVIRVLTLGEQTVMIDGVATTSSPLAGLNFMYSPDWSKLMEPKVWLAATGQIFFTLSVGIDRKSTRLNSSHVKISYAVF